MLGISLCRGGCPWLLRVTLDRRITLGRSSILRLRISLGLWWDGSSVLRLIVSLLGVSWVSGRILVAGLSWRLLVVVVRIVTSGEGSIGLVWEWHGGLDRVGQSSTTRGWSRRSRARGHAGSNIGRRGPAGRQRSRGTTVRIILASWAGGFMVSRSLGGSLECQIRQGGGEVLQQLILLRLPCKAEI